MHDLFIRDAFHRATLRKYHEDKNSLVLDEFGINHGAIRADIAVINGMLHGYEIKGDFDNLDRLPAQIEAYSAIFDKVTLVVSEKHLAASQKIIPNWWGVTLVKLRKSGKPHFVLVRNAYSNKSINKLFLAKLLWRSEALELLESLSPDTTFHKMDRETLYSQIVTRVSRTYLRKFVLLKLKKRKAWRDR